MYGAPPWTKRSPTPADDLRNNTSSWTKSTPPSKPSIPQGWRNHTQCSPQQWSNSYRLSTILSATITTQGHVHQHLLPAPTMGVTMSAIDNLTLKSMVQTINHI
jgi:hypothetical protein